MVLNVVHGLYLDSASSYRYRSVGGRLLYVPQTKISA